MNTRSKIVDRALEMFNERGIEYVGLRELAAVLEMRVSNITYYFPTKDHLVLEIATALTNANASVFIENEQMTMADFLGMLQQLFQNHIRFRCLLLSFVHILGQNKLVADSYKKTQQQRKSTIQSNIETLSNTGYLKLNEGDVEAVTGMLSLLNRFWLSEAAISFRKMNTQQQAQHYLRLLANLLLPYATAKGKKDIQVFLETI